jgi:hypothetical protein
MNIYDANTSFGRDAGYSVGPARGGKIFFVFPILGCLLGAGNDAYGGPINYSITKNYTFTTNLNVIPTLNEIRYGHAFDFNLVGGGVASNTAGQNKGYDPFSVDTYNKNFPNPAFPAVYNWAIFNRPNNLAPVPIVPDKINGLTVAGSPYNNSTNAGGASANVNATVTALAAKAATGTLAVSGSIPAPINGEQLFSIGYGQLTASANGANLAGKITDAGGMVINNLGAPRGIGSTLVKTGAADPVDLFEYNSAGALLSANLLYVSQGEVDGYGLLDWENGALNVTADDASLFVAAYPFGIGDPSGTLQLNIVNDVVSFVTTGTAFQSCQTTEISSSGSFSCALPTAETFNYSYNTNGSPITVTADFEDLGFTQATVTEPSTLLVVGSALLALGLLRQRIAA